ncbi:MAG: hypothetical protein HY951_01040 [Bacteroidia bacterium]|nr:hypothetical protein [Bacteroidia bacterium]
MNNIANTTGIRLEVPQDLYERLQAEQEKRRIKTGKKPALAAIIMDLCTIKLEENENVHSDVQSVQKSVQNSEHTDSAKDNALINTEKRLRKWEEQLSFKNKSLLEKEREIKEQEKEIFNEKMEILDLKSKVLDEREKLQQKTLEGTESIIELKLLQNESKHKDEKIQQLKEELSIAKSKSKKIQEDRKESEPKPFWEQIKPFLPVISGGIGLIAGYFIAKKNNKPELPSVLKEFAGLFDHMSEEDQKKLGEKLKYYADLHTDPAGENKILQLNINQTNQNLKAG